METGTGKAAADLPVFLFFPCFVSRLRWKHTSSLKVVNEPILAFTQGSPERDALQKVTGWGVPRVCGTWSKETGSFHPHLCASPQALKNLKGQTEAIPCVVGDEEVWTSDVQYQLSVSCRLPEFEFLGCLTL